MAKQRHNDMAWVMRNSKPMTIVSKQPVTVSTYKGFRPRKDFGLKRNMPNTKTPYLRVRQQDYRDGFPDFDNTGKHALFVKRWDEGGWSAQAKSNDHSRYLPQSWWDKDSITPTRAVDSDGNTASSDSPRQQHRFGDLPVQFSTALDHLNLESMSEVEFQAYLKHVQNLRPLFQKYLAHISERSDDALDISALSSSSSSSSPSSFSSSSPSPHSSADSDLPLPDMYAAAQKINPDHVSDFLAAHPFIRPKHFPTELAAMPHPTRALSYSPPSGIYNQYLSNPIPGRILYLRQTKSARGIAATFQWTVSALGINAGAAAVGSNIGVTQWFPDSNGNRDVDKGKARFRISSAITRRDDEDVRLFNESKAQQSAWPFEELISKHFVKTEGSIPETPLDLNLNIVSDSSEESNYFPGSAKYISSQADDIPFGDSLGVASGGVLSRNFAQPGSRAHRENFRLNLDDIRKRQIKPVPGVGNAIQEIEGKMMQSRRAKKKENVGDDVRNDDHKS